jgi:hypothetical protein
MKLLTRDSLVRRDVSLVELAKGADHKRRKRVSILIMM